MTSSHSATTTDPTYLYVAGRGHSGTTLLGALLGNHPQICGVGELIYLPLQCYRDERARWIGRCSCGERPFDCEFWGPIIDGIERRYGASLKDRPFSWRFSDAGLEEEFRSRAVFHAPLSWARNRFWRALRRHSYSSGSDANWVSRLYSPQRKWTERRDFLARQIAQQSGCPAVVDISKDYLDMRDLYDYSALKTRILFTTRDCRANVWSQVRMHCERNGPGARDKAEDVIVRSSKDWARVNRRILQVLNGVTRADWLQVRYEELCRDTNAELERILAFAGLSGGVSANLQSEGVQHSIAGNRMRFTGLTRGIREDLAWQENLRPDELQIIRDQCGSVAEQLGYKF